MTEDDFKIVERASAILHNEGFNEHYGGNTANIFWEAVRWIDKSLTKIHKETK